MHHSQEVCQSASHLACTHPGVALLIPVVLVLLMLALSAVAAFSATRKS